MSPINTRLILTVNNAMYYLFRTHSIQAVENLCMFQSIVVIFEGVFHISLDAMLAFSDYNNRYNNEDFFLRRVNTL